MPFKVSTLLEDASVRVGMRCRECGHEWTFDIPVMADRMLDSGTHRFVKRRIQAEGTMTNQQLSQRTVSRNRSAPKSHLTLMTMRAFIEKAL